MKKILTLLLFAVGLWAQGPGRMVSGGGAQGEYAGLDQYNLVIPRSLAGRGRVPVILTLGGRTSNPVYITIQ